MQTRSSPDVLLLDLILVGIDEGLITCEADLVRLYVWLCAVTHRRPAWPTPAPRDTTPETPGNRHRR